MSLPRRDVRSVFIRAMTRGVARVPADGLRVRTYYSSAEMERLWREKMAKVMGTSGPALDPSSIGSGVGGRPDIRVGVSNPNPVPVDLDAVPIGP